MLKIIQWPAKELKTRCEEINVGYINMEMSNILDMKETLRESGGLALAANQVGIMKRIVVDADGNTYVNPKITQTFFKKYNVLPEGCLSLPGYTDSVPRYDQVEVSFFDPKLGSHQTAIMTGISAVMIQHEIDHLDGIFFAETVKGGKDKARAWKRSHR